MSEYGYVSCNSLWVETIKNDPEGVHVVTAQERIKQYKRQDWLDMTVEAKEVVHSLGNLVINNVDYKSQEAKECFDYLMSHLSTWFFTPNKNYCASIAIAIRDDINYTVFFNQFQNGLAEYMINLLSYWGDSV